ncbi:MAG: oxygenase MpaB family protein [Lacisediminihabitans sp.]
MPKRLTDIAAESVLIAGGARTILLQIAHPAVGRGVARHSNFAAQPLLRLRNTLSYIYTIVYGTPDEAARAAERVGAAHATVRGRDYDANDPDLQLWVAATLYDTAVTMYETVFGSLDPEDADAIYREYAVLGTALQMPAELWPADRAAFRNYWDSALVELRVDDATLGVAGELLHPRSVPLWLRVSMPLARLVTAGLLTAELREAFELPWSERRERQFTRAMRVITAVYPRLPRRLRHWPKTHYLGGRSAGKASLRRASRSD